MYSRNGKGGISTPKLVVDVTRAINGTDANIDGFFAPDVPR